MNGITASILSDASRGWFRADASSSLPQAGEPAAPARPVRESRLARIAAWRPTSARPQFSPQP